MALDSGNPHDVNEASHNGQLAMHTHASMRQPFACDVLVSGMQGLGVEIGIESDNSIHLVTFPHVKQFGYDEYCSLLFAQFCSNTFVSHGF